jgi:hypothetical protein
MAHNQITFGIIFRKTSYAISEVSNFIECADGIEPVSHKNAYVKFLEDLLDGNITKSTLVDRDILNEFYNDLDNRASIDYREGHWDDDYDVYWGGYSFDQRAQKLKAHLDNK